MGNMALVTVNIESSTVVFGNLSTVLITGLYIVIRNWFKGFLPSAAMCPRIKYPISTGINVIDKNAAAAIA